MSTSSEQAETTWRDRGTVVREPSGPGRARVREFLRQPRKRIEGQGDNAHASAFSKRPIGGRVADRRRRNKVARAARRGNRS